MKEENFKIYLSKHEIVLEINSDKKTGYIYLSKEAFKKLFLDLDKNIKDFETDNGKIQLDMEYYSKFKDKGKFVHNVLKNLYGSKKVSPNLFVSSKKRKK